jgi:hypothetical protein
MYTQPFCTYWDAMAMWTIFGSWGVSLTQAPIQFYVLWAVREMECSTANQQHCPLYWMPCQMYIFSQRSGSGDLLGWRLGNHSLPTSLPSNTNWCFCCSPYPCWIPAMHCGLGFGNIPKHTVWKGSGYIYTCMECSPSVKPWLARSVPCKMTYATAEYAT